MQTNNQVFAKVIDDMAKSALKGLVTDSSWEWCFRENSTYLDCPTAEYPIT